MANCMPKRTIEKPTKQELTYMNELNLWLSAMYQEVSATTMYEYFFDGCLEEEEGDGKGNLHVYLQQEEWEEDKDKLGNPYRGSQVGDLDLIARCEGRTFALSNPITYWGKSGRSRFAHECCGFIIDLDNVKTSALREWALERWSDKPLLVYKEVMDQNWFMPLPTFMVSTGHGLHLVYTLDKPVRLFKSNIRLLNLFKASLTGRVWVPELTEETRQVQSIFQQYRVPGSKTKFGEKVRVFQTGPIWKIEDLFTYTNLNHKELKQINTYKKLRKMTLTQAAKRYPNWYLRKGDIDSPRKVWESNSALYKWWRDQIIPERKQNNEPYVTYGHRYYVIYSLAIFAIKCGIPKEELRKDAYSFQDYFNQISPKNPFTDEDIEAAISAGYKRTNMRFPFNTIKRLTQIFPPSKKRNFREQGQHLRLARRQLAELVEMGEVKVGRPRGSNTKEQQIKKFAAKHPTLSNRKIAEALGVSRNTVNKWLK